MQSYCALISLHTWLVIPLTVLSFFEIKVDYFCETFPEKHKEATKTQGVWLSFSCLIADLLHLPLFPFSLLLDKNKITTDFLSKSITLWSNHLITNTRIH